MKKKIIIILIIISLLATNALAFTDVKDNWAKPYIEWASDQGFFEGYKDGTFRPKSFITKAEFVTVISRLVVDQAGVKLKLTDVKEGAWYYDALAKIVGLGLIENAGEFKGREKIIRAEAFRLIAGIYKLSSDEKLEYHFNDAVIVNNHAGLGRLIADGIIVGDGENNLLPLKPIRRQEMCKILKEAYDKYDKNEKHEGPAEKADEKLVDKIEDKIEEKIEEKEKNKDENKDVNK